MDLNERKIECDGGGGEWEGGQRGREPELRLPDRAVWSSPSETLHRHCETSRESQRVRADMTV